MKIALAQISPKMGDFEYNTKKIVEFINKAHKQSCDLCVFPEACLFGYYPMDLLEYSQIIKKQLQFLKKIEAKMPKNFPVLVGAFEIDESRTVHEIFNSAVLLQKGKKPRFFRKELLPNYSVFDEKRHVSKGDTSKNILKIKSKKILVTICEDIWFDTTIKRARHSRDPLKAFKSKDVDIIVNLSASPFTPKKAQKKLSTLAKAVSHLNAPMIYVNMVGGQEENIYDGNSFTINSHGELIQKSKSFEEDLQIVDLDEAQKIKEPKKDKRAMTRTALSLGIKDYCRKTGFKKVHLGLSGGVDSALVAVLACEAVGSENVTAIALPGPYSSAESFRYAEKMCENLNIPLLSLDINQSYDLLNHQLKESFDYFELGIVNENLQARLRGLSLMAYSNIKNSLLLNTSNKSEIAMGYGTLYGDLCGGLSPIGDLLKTEVYELCQHINKNKEIILQEIIERPPTAELRPNQTDQDTLPAYEDLDSYIHQWVEKKRIPSKPEGKKVIQTLLRNEFKRKRHGTILRMSDQSFSRDWRMPVVNGLHIN